MYDAGKVIPGIIVFLILISFPIWYNVASGKGGGAPELELPADAEKCVEDAEEMRTEHMTLLNRWRDEVVRKGNRVYVAGDGQHYDMSLSNTCMSCHSNKAEFCDQCHNYVGVVPYCWDCHIEPKENE